MKIGTKGEGLIFVISQPRAGSTLLQRMLGGHPDIHTVGEPWLMLYPLYALRPHGYDAEYSAPTARPAVHEFLSTLPHGEEEYIEGVRRMCTYLYGCALEASGKRYFLDKTPRYYLIIPELIRTFPEAHYIILLRNPLSMLISVIETWIKNQWSWVYYFKNDLVRAPPLLLEGARLLGERGLVVHYEQVVTNPEEEIRRICRALGEDFTAEMVEYNRHNLPHWHYGDQKGVYEHARPVAQNTQKWVEAIREPQVWRLAHDYLQWLGRETVEQMGYAYSELEETLEAHRPHRARLWLTFPLAWYLEEQMENRRKWERGVARLAHSLRRRGVKGTAAGAAHKTTYAISSAGDLPHT
jgi:hypothetical protein